MAKKWTAEDLEATALREATEKSPEDIEAEETAKEAAERAAQIAAGPAPSFGMNLNAGLHPKSDGTVTVTFEQMLELFKAATAGNAVTPEAIAQIASTAAQKVSDANAPRIKEVPMSMTERKSAYNPLGERDHPRPKLKCHMYFGSAPLGSPKEVTTLTMAEITALNKMTPGHFRIQKMDGSHQVVEVKGQVNSNRELDRLWILLPEGDDQQNLYPPLASFAEQCSDVNRVNPVIA